MYSAPKYERMLHTGSLELLFYKIKLCWKLQIQNYKGNSKVTTVRVIPDISKE